MNRLPKLINWNALAHLSKGMNKKANAENNENIDTKEKPVTDAMGVEHRPKDGFSGPHLNSEGMAYYVKDGKMWCPYQKKFMDEKKASIEDFAEMISFKFAHINKIVSNPSMLSNFCSYYGYEGEPIACIRAAASSSDPAMRKFAMLAAMDVEQRIIKKKAENQGQIPRIIDPNEKAPNVKGKVMSFMHSAASRADEKTIADIFDVMINDVKKTEDKVLLDIINTIVDPEEAPAYENEIQEKKRLERQSKMAEKFFEPLNEKEVQLLIEAMSEVISKKWIEERDVLRSSDSVERQGTSFAGEFAEPGTPGAIGIHSNPSSITGYSGGKQVQDKATHDNVGVIKDSSAEDDLEKEAKKKKKKSSGGESTPTNPALWKRCLAWARSKYDVCPSAYCNGAAAKRYKKLGGGWRKKKKGKKS